MRKNKFLIIGIVIAVLAGVVLIILSTTQKFEYLSAEVITDKNEYNKGGGLKVKIENNLEESICFSSCYPYYFEKKIVRWKTYPYIECPFDDLVEVCISPKQVKAFELIVPSLEEGNHRLAIPACIGCNLNQLFESDSWFYSNSFVVE